jgi:hypothetical protein
MDKITYIEEEMTSEQWENYCKKIKEENRQKIRDAQKNRNSTAPFANTTATANPNGCDENHCFCDMLDEWGDSVCKHDVPSTFFPMIPNLST